MHQISTERYPCDENKSFCSQDQVKEGMFDTQTWRKDCHDHSNDENWFRECPVERMTNLRPMWTWIRYRKNLFEGVGRWRSQRPSTQFPAIPQQSYPCYFFQNTLSPFQEKSTSSHHSWFLLSSPYIPLDNIIITSIFHIKYM